MAAGGNLRSSTRRSAGDGLRRSGRQTRQVRFQPIPQAIDISCNDDDDDDDDDGQEGQGDQGPTASSEPGNCSYKRHEQSFSDESLTEHNKSMTVGQSGAEPKAAKRLARVQQQLNRLSKKSRIHLNSSAKPLTRKLHTLSNLKFANIKLKSFNGLANQLQQTLTNNQAAGGQQWAPGAEERARPQESAGQSGPRLALHSSLASKGIRLLQSRSHRAQKVAAPIQRTFHIRNSAASAKHQITLGRAGAYQSSVYELTEGEARGNNEDEGDEEKEEDEDGDGADKDNETDDWGSDFDETQSSSGDCSLTAAGCSSGGQQAGTNRYLLEIGRPNYDSRAIGDVIQDQGISGQFKRLEPVSSYTDSAHTASKDTPTDRRVPLHDATRADSSTSDKLDRIRGSLQHTMKMTSTMTTSQKEGQEQELGTHFETLIARIESPDDEEAELRSLEARQGYRQVRDKLKLILDQRLAGYERDLNQARPREPSGTAQPDAAITPRPTVATSAPEKSSSSSSVCIASTQNQAHHTGRPCEPKVRLVVVNGTAGKACDSTDTRGGPGSGNAYTVHTNVNHKGNQHQGDRFDCQSNCSEASSLSSGGLDSNHSGSQDSGHSTQHSGYSALIRRRSPCRAHQDDPCQCAGAQDQARDDSSPASPQLPLPTAASHESDSPTIQLDSGASTCGEDLARESGQAPASSDDERPCSTATPGSPHSSAASSGYEGGRAIDEPEQRLARGSETERELESARRNRFIQNRLIINNKLESMFKSRCSSASALLQSGTPSSSPKRQTRTEKIMASPCSLSSAAAAVPVEAGAGDSPKSTQSCPTPPNTRHPRPSSTMSSCSGSLIGSNPLEAAIRVRLLEQQRQMSLKLKQKPRRRSAKRALELISTSSPVYCSTNSSSSSSYSSSSACNASLDGRSITTDDNGSYTPAASQQIVQNLNHRPRNESGHEATSGQQAQLANSNQIRDSLSKQLSMVCLRQLDQQQQQHQQQLQQQIGSGQLCPSGLSDSHVKQSEGAGLPSQTPRLALSLRQLVKEVIDDCEKPNKLSTLTRDILNRSDSLSSDGLSAVATSTTEPVGGQSDERKRPPLTSSPLRAPSRAGATRENPAPGDHNSTLSVSLSALSSVEVVSSSQSARRLDCDEIVDFIDRHHSHRQMFGPRSSSSVLLPEPSIKPIGIIPNPEFRHLNRLDCLAADSSSSSLQTDHFSSPNQKDIHRQHANQVSSTPSTGRPLDQSTYYVGQQQYQQQLHGNDFSIASSLGTIDGLEYSPSINLSTNGSVDDHHRPKVAVLQSSPKSSVQTRPGPTGAQLQSALKNGHDKQHRSAASIGSYWKTLRQFSRFKMPKVNLAYLDNTNNFFTDDDN